MITHSVRLEVLEDGKLVPVTGRLTRCEDLGANVEDKAPDDVALAAGKFELFLDDGQTGVSIRGIRAEFSRLLRFMDE